MMRDRVSTFLFLGIAVFTVLGELTEIGWFRDTAVVSVLLLLVLEFTRIPLIQKSVGIVLILGGVITAAFTDDIFGTLYTGIVRALPFLLLFASVAWLQEPSSQSPSLLAVREMVMRQGPGKRFAWVMTVAHFLGVAFNLAGLSLLTPMVAKGAVARLQKRLSRAMIQGFSAGTCWSPLYVGTAVIIASVPGVNWLDVGPTGFVIAMAMLVWSWIVDRLFSRRKQPHVIPTPIALDSPDHPMTGLVWIKLAMILITLFGCIIGMVEGLGWSIPIALAVTAPLYAMIWAFFIGRSGTGSGLLGTARHVFRGLPGLRGETILFTGANLLGVGVAALIPDGSAGSVMADWAIPSEIILLAIMVGYAVASAVGLHPVVTVVLVTTILTPTVIGVPPALLALSLMVMWGQGTNVSPFSATNLYMARVTGQSAWVTAWRWNLPFVVSSTLLLAGTMIVLLDSGWGL